MPDPSVPSRPAVRRQVLRVALVPLVGLALALAAAPAPTSAEPTTDRYIVRADSASAAARIAGATDAEIAEPELTDETPATFSTELTAVEADRLADDPGVDAVVPDRRIRRVDTASTASSTTAPPWGLDRIDQRRLPVDGAYRTPTTGEGVVVAVVDSGLNASHRAFSGRVLDGYDFVEHDETPQDCDGHGTHVAGTAAGAGYGVAPGAWILPVRVFDCHGEAWASDVLAAFETVLAYSRDVEERVVVNFSGGGPVDAAALEIEAVVRELYAAGVPVVTAAGNTGADACLSSPGRVPAAITVAATTSTDRRAGWSDRGRCVDLFAPGAGIRSSWIGSSTAARQLDGTSMAAPHVTGVVARFLQREPRASSGQVWGAVRDLSTWDVVSDPAGSPNRLVYADVRFGAPGQPTSSGLRTDHAGRSAVLTWKAPSRDNGRSVTGYRVTRSGTDSRGRGPETVVVAKGELSRTFRYLVPGRSYTFTVAAINAIGTGKPATRSTTVLAAPGRPAKPVLRSGSTSDSSVSVTVDWSTPSGGEVERYLVTVRRTSDGATRTVEVPASSTWVKVTGLSRGRTYVASVRSANAAGTSGASPLSGSATAR